MTNDACKKVAPTKTPAEAQAHNVVKSNVRLAAKLERESAGEPSPANLISSRIMAAAGKGWFAVVHLIVFAAWLIANSGLVAVRAFDPFPFSLLTLVLSVEAIFLSLIILMVQNREARRADARAKLDLQINLLAERENTRLLKLVLASCAAQGINENYDAELKELLRPTSPEEVLEQLLREEQDE